MGGEERASCTMGQGNRKEMNASVVKKVAAGGEYAILAK